MDTESRYDIKQVETPLVVLGSHRDLLGMLSGGPRIDLLFTDPPWAYHDSGKKNDKLRGQAAAHYDTMSDADIALALAAFSDRLNANRYVALWCTFPKMGEWFAASRMIFASCGLEYITGAAWGKVDPYWGGKLGAGHHVRGDAELLLLYRFGKPKPRTTLSNWWVAPRKEHSEKPQTVLRDVVEMTTDPGGLVVDPFAGDTGSLALACRSLGRLYLGSEIDPARQVRAMLRLSQQEMELSA